MHKSSITWSNAADESGEHDDPLQFDHVQEIARNFKQIAEQEK